MLLAMHGVAEGREWFPPNPCPLFRRVVSTHFPFIAQYDGTGAGGAKTIVTPIGGLTFFDVALRPVFVDTIRLRMVDWKQLACKIM